MSTQHVTLIQVFTIGWEQIKKVNGFPNQALFSLHSCNSDHIYSNHEKDVRVCFFPQTKWQLFRGCKLAPEILISSIYTYIHFHLFSGFILKTKIMTNWYFVRIKLSNLSPYKYGAFWHVSLFFFIQSIHSNSTWAKKWKNPAQHPLHSRRKVKTITLK